MATYAFPGSNHTGKIKLPVRYTRPDGTAWSGDFECAVGQNVNILHWPEANSIVVLAANALYIVNPENPDYFYGFEAPIRIDNAMFDERGERLFVAESKRIHAYSREPRLLWVSQDLNGYDAKLTECANGLVMVELKEDSELADELDDQSIPRRIVRIRAEDGAIVPWPDSTRSRLLAVLRKKMAA